MRTVYCEKFGRKVAATDNLYVLSDRVRPGQILQVLNCYAHAPECAATDIIWIGVRSGGQDVLVRARAAVTESEGLSALNPFLVGESDAIFAYFPSATLNETIEIHINGILMSLEDWRQAGP